MEGKIRSQKKTIKLAIFRQNYNQLHKFEMKQSGFIPALVVDPLESRVLHRHPTKCPYRFQPKYHEGVFVNKLK